jgi:hypothetical protein
MSDIRKKNVKIDDVKAVGNPNGAGGSEKSTDADRPDGNVSGIVKRFKKRQSADAHAISLGLIKDVHSNAIEYTGISGSARGLMIFLCLLGAGVSLWVGYDNLMVTLRDGVHGFFDLSMILISACFIYVGLHMGIKGVRFELFRPIDEPTIFDRKNRKVYRIFRESYAGWRGLWMRWPMKYAEYDWDLVDAEHQASLSTTGSTLMRYHGLIFLVRKSSDDPTIVGSFAIGNNLQMGELTVPAVWEHIRRFMESDGPHLPIGEVLKKIDPPETLLQCLAATGPYGKNFRGWWRHYTGLMILAIVFFPLVFPSLTLLGIFTWLGYKTSIPIKWPKHVQDAINS